jgi:hypothetical protein
MLCLSGPLLTFNYKNKWRERNRNVQFGARKKSLGDETIVLKADVSLIFMFN